MEMILYYIIIFVVSLCSTWWIFKKVLKIAKRYDIVDNPSERKLHRVPVPVMGGIAVFFGMVVALAVAGIILDLSGLFTMLCVMTLMLYVGCVDDILGLSPGFRFFIEIIAVLILIYCNEASINNFHGLWGIYEIPQLISVPLTVFACVGIINSINLIDGVNGLSSGYGIVTSAIFGAVFLFTEDYKCATLAILCVGSLIPFFIHNVFGNKSKMFIGDGGTLLMGTIMSVFVINALKTESPIVEFAPDDFGVIPFTLAVLAIPVFDTIRVMLFRIGRGRSPFRPDKTHLHHMLIDLHFSHLGITMIEIFANLFIIAAWYLAYKAGASIDIQLYVVIFLGILVTTVFYCAAHRWKRKQCRIYHWIIKVGDRTNMGHTRLFEWLAGVLDRNC